MALDFDDDHEPSFQDLVDTARTDVLKGRAMAQCWSELADQHSFFKDIAKEGRTRGETLGTVLAAVNGIGQAVRRAEAAEAATEGDTPQTIAQPGSSGAAAGNASNALEAATLVRVADAYLQLYTVTPVPTRAQWLASLQSAASGASGSRSQGEVASGAPPAHAAPPLSSSTVGRYLARLNTSLSAVAQELAGDADAEGEDGSFAEEELKELVRCCLTAGRRVARHVSLAKAEAKTVREMVKALQDYVGSSTLEW